MCRRLPRCPARGRAKAGLVAAAWHSRRPLALAPQQNMSADLATATATKSRSLAEPHHLAQQRRPGRASPDTASKSRSLTARGRAKMMGSHSCHWHSRLSRPLAAKREVPRIRKRPLAAKLRRFRGRSRTRLAARAPRTRIAAVAAETTLVVHRIHRHLRALRPESAARPLAAETTLAAIAVHLRPEGRFLMVFKVASTSQVARRPLAATRCCSGSGHWISF